MQFSPTYKYRKTQGIVTDDHNWRPSQSWLTFAGFTLVLLWLIHALVFFPHEYAHSFSAWLLGWKSNPLALNYGSLNAGNLLAQLDIDENVDYAPIFASGNGHQAAFIAVAGMLIGNVLVTYAISIWGYRWALRHQSRTWGMFFYWMWVASIGNFIDYVPVRTFAPHGDMYTVVQGLKCSPWLIIIVLGIPFIIAIVHFFIFLAPSVLNWLFPRSPARRAIVAVLTAFLVFGFYGIAGLSGYGETSHLISAVCFCAFMPVMMIILLWLTNVKMAKKYFPNY